MCYMGVHKKFSRLVVIFIFFLAFGSVGYSYEGVQRILEEPEGLTPSRHTWVDRETGLMIETGLGQWGHNDFITYELDFPSKPAVVMSSQKLWQPLLVCAADHTSDGFRLKLMDHNGNVIQNAWVMWIAVYPEEYRDPPTGLVIEADCSLHSHYDLVQYNQDFPGTPHVVVNAQSSGVPKMACAVDHNSDGFILALKDHNGNEVEDAYVFWLAVYPSEYVNAATGLKIETGLGQHGHEDHISYDLNFPGVPRAVTSAQWGMTPRITSPVNLSSEGFDYAAIDHNGSPAEIPWSFFISVYPSAYAPSGTATPTATPTNTATPATGTPTSTSTPPTGTDTPTPTPTGSQPTGTDTPTPTPTGTQPSGTSSPTPTENPNQTGGLNGFVYNSITGSPVEGATVTIPGKPVRTTNGQGNFSYQSLNAGNYTVTVSKFGYHNAVETVQIQADSVTNVNIALTPMSGGAIQVVSVSSRYCSPNKHCYYLDDVFLNEEFTAVINWGGHQPYQVEWETPQHTYVDSCTGNSVSRTFNMGQDFGPGGRLKVTAVSNNPPAQSVEYPVNFKVIQTPPGILPSLLYHSPGFSTLKYVSPKLSFQPIKFDKGVEAGVIPEDMPMFGQEAFKFASAFDFSATVKGDGSASGIKISPDPGESLKTKIAGFKFKPSVSAQVAWDYYEGYGWLPGGNVQIGASIGADVPPHPVPFVFFGIPCYWRGHIDVGASLSLAINNWSAPGVPLWGDATFHLSPFPYAEAALGVGAADVVAVEGYLGGGARMSLQFHQTVDLQSLQLYLSGGVRIVLWFITYELPLLDYSWDMLDKEMLVDHADPVIRVMSRDYLNKENYALFTANDFDGRRTGKAETVEMAIQLNVFGQSMPAVAANGNNLMLIWLYDDPQRSDVDRTELIYSYFDAQSGVWSSPLPVADDDTADYHPAITSVSNGMVLAAWENAKTQIGDSGNLADESVVLKKFDETMENLEIAVSFYQYAAGEWMPQMNMTDNDYLDRSPLAAGTDDGKAMLTWISNKMNDEIGSSTAPNEINFTVFNGQTWTVPAYAAENIGAIIKSSMHYDGDEALYVYSSDMDEDVSTLDDRELFVIEFDGESWSAPVRLTNDNVEDANPKVIYDYTGNPLIVWYSDGNLEAARNITLSDRHIVVDQDNSASSGLADFELAESLNGEIAVMWQEASEELVDMWTVIYDPGLNIWSLPQLVTEDISMEYAFDPVFKADGSLMAFYDKAQIQYETRTVQVGGEEVVVDNVPVPGQVDLYALWYGISGDLAVYEDDIQLDPPNASSGDTATITALIRNEGDMPAEELDVHFFCGNPENGGTLIQQTTLTETLAGGANIEALTEWTVPPTSEIEDIYVIVDYYYEQEDSDRTNNVAVLAIKPDAVIDYITAQQAGPTLVFNVRAANEGSMPLENLDVVLHSGSLNGPVLHAFHINDSISNDAFVDLQWQWDNPFQEMTVYAVADEYDLVNESNEDNNTNQVYLQNFGDDIPTAPSIPAASFAGLGLLVMIFAGLMIRRRSR